jgi:O-antigen/teichoic acid export membrane protein
MSKFSLKSLLALLRRPAAIYLLANVLGRIGGIVLIPIYTKKLTQTEYGAYGLITSLTSLLPLCISCGLTAGLSKAFFDTKDVSMAKQAVGSIAKGMIAIAAFWTMLATLVVLVALPHGIMQLTQRQLLLVLCISFANCVGFVPDNYLRAAQKPIFAVATQLGQFLLTTSLGIYLVAFKGRGVDGAIEAGLGASLVAACVGFWLTFVHLGGRDVIKHTRSVLRFSLAFVPHFMASWAQEAGDRWILSAFGDRRALGSYYLSVQLLSPIPMVTGAWNGGETPRVGELFRDGGMAAVFRELPTQFRRSFAAAALPTALLVFGSPLLPLVINARFAQVLFILPVLALAYLFDSLYYPSTNVIFYSGYSKAIPTVTVLTSVVGLSLCYVLLRRFGVPGLLVARVATSFIRSLTLGLVARSLGKRMLRTSSTALAAVSTTGPTS